MPIFTDTPKANDILANSQVDLNENFEYLQQRLNIDHKIEFDVDPLGDNQQGLHRLVSLFPTGLANPPLTPGSQNMIFTSNNNLFVKNSGNYINPVQLTDNNVVPTIGSVSFTFLPGGLMIAFGRSSITNGDTSINFPNGGFSSPVLTVSITPVFIASPISAKQIGLVGLPSATLFKVHSEYATGDCKLINWIAIGVK